MEISDTTRSVFHNEMKTLSDINVVNGTWYRFNGGANSQMMITYPVQAFKCGTLWPGWLTSKHPLSIFAAFL